MFSFACQKRTRKAPATFEAREARIKGCSPLIIPKKKALPKNRAVRQSAQTLFRFFGRADFNFYLTLQRHETDEVFDDLAADDEAGDGGHKGVGTGD